MRMCVFRACRAWMNSRDLRCPSCGRLQESLAAVAEMHWLESNR